MIGLNLMIQNLRKVEDEIDTLKIKKLHLEAQREDVEIQLQKSQNIRRIRELESLKKSLEEDISSRQAEIETLRKSLEHTRTLRRNSSSLKNSGRFGLSAERKEERLRLLIDGD